MISGKKGILVVNGVKDHSIKDCCHYPAIFKRNTFGTSPDRIECPVPKAAGYYS
jgi:hypothetical protein